MESASSSQENFEPPRKRSRHEEPTQFRHWRFSRNQLAEIRSANNAAAIERVKRNKEAERKQDEDVQTPAPNPTSTADTPEPTKADEDGSKLNPSNPAGESISVATETAVKTEEAGNEEENGKEAAKPKDKETTGFIKTEEMSEKPENFALKTDAKPEGKAEPVVADTKAVDSSIIGETEEPEVQYLTVDEEMVLCKFYEERVQKLAAICRLPDIVWATAIIYMKRFYLHNTVMDYHPKHVCITSLFLATKSENERMSIEQFCTDMRKDKEEDKEDVLALEFVISQGLKFEYYIHHPFRACHGFFLDMDQAMPKDTRKLKEAFNRAMTNVRLSLLTDLCFLYQPSQIALGCFQKAGSDMSWDGVQNFISTKFAANLTMLAPILDDVQRTLSASTSVEQAEAARIDRLLIKSSNPAKNPESALYKKRLADREMAEESKRQKKIKAKEEDLASIVL